MPDKLSKAIYIADQRCQQAYPRENLIMFMGQDSTATPRIIYVY